MVGLPVSGFSATLSVERVRKITRLGYYKHTNVRISGDNIFRIALGGDFVVDGNRSGVEGEGSHAHEDQCG